MEQLTKILTEQIVSDIARKTENVLKAEMISRHLTVEDVKMVSLNDEDDTDLFIDMKNRKVFLRRTLTKNPFKFHTSAAIESGIELKLQVVNEEIPQMIFQRLIAVDDVKFRWNYKAGSKGYFHIPYDQENGIDLVKVTWKRDDVWSIEVVGVMKEHISGYGLESVNEVLKIAEDKVYQTMDRIQDIIKRSTNNE